MLLILNFTDKCISKAKWSIVNSVVMYEAQLTLKLRSNQAEYCLRTWEMCVPNLNIS